MTARVRKRPFGTSGIDVSPLIFGSMRLDPARLPAHEARELLAYLIASGVTTWHSSHEYEHHAFFCEMLAQVQPPSPVHVMKLGEPHFDAPRFRRERFIALIEQELRALRAERIDIVQWLLRATPNDDANRLPLLAECIGEVEETAASLQRAGKIGALACFPYSPATAAFCLPRPACAGLVSYLNPVEQECVPFLGDMQRRGQGYLAIRPLCGGKLLNAAEPEGPTFIALCEREGIAPDARAAYALRWPLTLPTVSGVIVSVSSMEHARAAVSALQSD